MPTVVSDVSSVPGASCAVVHPRSGASAGLESIHNHISRRPRLVGVSTIDLTLFAIGAVVTGASYGTPAPVATAGAFWIFGLACLALTPAGGRPERRCFTRVFSVLFLVSGLAAVYANQWLDPVQLQSDAASFYEMSAYLSAGLSLEDIGTEGALAVMIWRAVYDGFSQLGFEKARYIGVGVNIMAVALTGVVGVKMVRNLYGDDVYRFNRLTWLVATSGLFWLFASLHLRDAFVLFIVSVLTYAWQWFLVSPNLSRRLLITVTLSVLSFIYLGYLRREFAHVPVAMVVAAAAAVFTARAKPGRRLFLVALAVCVLTLAGLLLWQFSEQLQTAITGGADSYTDHMNSESASGSLGLSLIVNQAAPVRLVLGGLYLFAFPIPVWVGFQLRSAYHLFISLNTVGFYVLLPLVVLALRELIRDPRQRRPAAVFLVHLSAGFAAAIALTSLEVRHLGAFLMTLLVLGTIPDLRTRSTRTWYRRLLVVELSLMVAVHGTWILLKFL